MNYQLIKVTEDDDQIRLDRWFHRHFPHISKGLVDKLARKGAIRLDGKRAKGQSRVSTNMEIKIPPSILQAQKDSPARKEKPKISTEDLKQIEQSILYEDRFILAINKPAGLASQGGSKIKKSVDDILKAWAEEKDFQIYLVHRLDKDTSGVLLLAKSPKMASELTHGFQQREIQKTYLALLTGNPKPKEGHIDMPLLKGQVGAQQKVYPDWDHGSRAETLYQVLESAGQKMSLVAFSPLTGRTHQLRVHAAEALKYPILGDGKYGGENAFAEGLSKKLHLHAWQLNFRHPQTKEMMQITAPILGHMEESLKTLSLDMPDANLIQINSI